ncbi:MAG TPA: DEAD/DEAH box helicase [Microlunatus sp.]|nr:DEAD/DEAH box helicase [Microlunatus sp.]
MTSSNTFIDLGVPADLVRVLTDRGITIPTPIQAATMADSIDGRDVLGRGRTGSGKTYAFLVPLVTRLRQTAGTRRPGRPRALVLAPTRELALQIHAVLQPLAEAAGLRSHTIFGGVGQLPQVRALQSGIDVVIACPGRLEDLVRQGHCRLDAVEVSVLDEADHMADLGFLPAVTRLLTATPSGGQRLFFSATLDHGIDGLVRRFLHHPSIHHADSPQAPVGAMSHHVLQVGTAVRLDVLADLAAARGRTVIFTRTKHRAKGLARQLNARGVSAVELHGDLAQNARTRNLEAFHAGRATTLVATDIAARGIHVDDIELVVHADPPVEHKAYVHRSGRTARAGKAGTVVTLMTDDQTSAVRTLVRAAGIKPTVTVIDSVTDPILRTIASGERHYGTAVTSDAAPTQRGEGPGRDRNRSTSARRGSARPGSPRPGSAGTSSSGTSSSRTGGSGGSRSRRQSTGAPRPAGSRPGAGGSAVSADHTAAHFSRRLRTR